MTRQAKKEAEERQVKAFLKDLIDFTALDADEPPDFWIRRPPDIALEVTEYHPLAAEGQTGKTRVEVEATWWKYLEPVIDRERMARPSLKNVQVHLGFEDTWLPRKNQCAAVAKALVAAVEAAASCPRFDGGDTEIEFDNQQLCDSRGSYLEGTILLPEANWPDASRRLRSLSISRQGMVDWMPWNCLNATTAWLAADVEEFRRILKAKTKAAKNYNLGGVPLWLLIVCDINDDGDQVKGDLSSHIFPRNEAE
jgi:hypothetical protein